MIAGGHSVDEGKQTQTKAHAGRARVSGSALERRTLDGSLGSL